MKILKDKIKELLFPNRMFEKVYSGNIFNRFNGLEPVFKVCKSQTILDIGSAEGLIDYEFARNGCSLIHGFERDPKRVKFSKLLFQEVPIESEFRVADLSQSHNKFDNKYTDILLKEYDIVLYLGVYHHLIKQAKKEDVHDFIKYLLKKTKNLFVVRTNMITSFEKIVIKEGFEIYSEDRILDVVGKLKIYKRK